MSEDETPAESGVPPPEAEAPPPRRRLPWAESGLVLVLCVVVAGVAASPLWAPPLAPLLPWSKPPPQYRALARRLGTLETSHNATTAVQHGLAQRLSAVEARAAAADPAQISKEIGQLDERVAALEKRPAVAADDLAKMQQEVARIGTVAADLAVRLPALEKRVATLDETGGGAAARLVALLRLREAMDRGQPFAGEYRALAALGKDDPQVAAALAIIAKFAESGVASRAALAERLHDLAPRLTGTAEPPPAGDWRAATLARLQGLVKIRRIDSAAGQAANAGAAAEQAMARGDLAGAVAAFDKLSGADAAAARPWLEAARARIAAENALADVERAVIAPLGTSGTAPHKGATVAPARSSGPS
jgi:hypothetical protein